MKPILIGIDAGGLNSVSWLACLQGQHFRLNHQCFTAENAELPWFSGAGHEVVAIDAPQGLPLRGDPCRRADSDANTPMRVFPASRRELESGFRGRDGIRYPYIGLLRLGCLLFWANRKHVHDLGGSTGKLIETYPREIVRRWANETKIPPKRKQPEAYIELVTSLLRQLGYSWDREDRALCVDDCDAMLCALAAQSHSQRKADYLGKPPILDDAEEILREGFIVVPKASFLHTSGQRSDGSS